MNSRASKRAFTAAMTSLAILAGCGGSDDTSGSDPLLQTPDSQLFVQSGPTLGLTVLGINRTTGSSFEEATTLNAPSTLIGGHLDGTVSYERVFGAENTIALSSGGTASLEDVGNSYVFRFGNADIFGVGGLAATSMRTSGSATYSGGADVIVNDGSGAPIVLTNVVATADFGLGQVDTRLTNDQSFWLSINDAAISGNRYSDGMVSVSSRFATDPGTSGALVHEGGFFAPDGSEIGGAFVLDRTGANINFKAQGAYSGAR